jgi:hypothetical protein
MKSMAHDATELDALLANQTRYLSSSTQASPGGGMRKEADFEADTTAIQLREIAARDTDGAPRAQEAEEAAFLHLSGADARHAPAWTLEDRSITKTVARNPEFLRQLPSRRRCDALLEGYINGYHPMVPLIHVPTFRYRYEQFWKTKDDPNATETASMAFAALMVAILYAGSVACPDAVSSGAVGAPQPEEAATHLHILALRALRLSNFPRTPTFDSFRAYIICQSTWMREEEPLTCVAFVGLALRVATMLGLHKDPSHFSNIDPIECEIRRRVWWHLVHIDVLVAIASGLPPIVDLDTWDVQGISELKEDYFGTPIGTQYDADIKRGQRPHDSVADPRDPANRSMVSTVGVLVAGKLRATRE